MFRARSNTLILGWREMFVGGDVWTLCHFLVGWLGLMIVRDGKGVNEMVHVLCSGRGM